MEFVSVTIEDHVATVTLDRPPVNAATTQVLRELRDAFRAFTDDKDVRVAIFRAAGERAFIAGIDLRSIDEDSADAAPLILDRGVIVREAMWSIYDCAVPVIAAVNGPAIGLGLALAALCDIIVAADTATFSTTEINVGLLGAGSHLGLLLPRHKVRELFFTGEAISAAELHRLGAVRAVVPQSELQATALELARSLAGKSPVALRLAKESLNRTEFLPLKDAYRTEQDYTNRLLGFEDAKEARAAFFERRPPEWKWR